jgi:hypothetical protein
VDSRKRLLTNIAGILMISIVGAVLTTGVDLGGNRWLKFVLYAVFFASISSPAAFSSHYSCSSMLRRLRK